MMTLAVMMLAAVSASFAQQDDRAAATAAAIDRYVISAEAGGVNYVEGSVSIERKAGKSGILLKRDKVAVGDVVATGADGRAEILLNPGSFLRVGPNSQFEFTSTSLEDLQVSLRSGSAIFEVYAAQDFRVRITTPGAKVYLIESGVFRIDAFGKRTTVAVWKGKAQADDVQATVITAGREAVISNGSATVAKFDRDEKDAFEAWSNTRAKDLAKLTASLKNGMYRRAMMQSLMGGGWNMYNSFGLWVFDPFSGVYCFLPFGRGWRSPYGYRFGGSIWDYNGWYPYGGWQPVYGGGGSGGNGGGSGGGNSNQPTVTPIATAGDRSPIPPFVRMEGSGGLGGGRGLSDPGSGFGNSGNSGSSGGSNGSGNSGGVTYSAPPSSTPVSSPPSSSSETKTVNTTRDN